MSFDLGFWSAIPAGEPPSRVYQRLVEGQSGVAVEDRARIAAFHSDVVAVYPDLAVVEDDVDWDEDDDSPWAAGIYYTGECMIVSISWSRREELEPFLRNLARAHGLSVYDPQQQVLES